MAKIIVCPNLVEQEIVEHFDYNGPYIDWLQKHYPNGFEGLHVTAVNCKKLKVEDYDLILTDVDFVVLGIHPGDPGSIAAAYAAAAAWWASASALTKFIISIVVSMALSYLANSIFGNQSIKPKKTGSPSSTYDLSVPTNQARLGQPIPVIYGTIITVPDLAAAPFKWHLNNEVYAGLLMCIGQGEYQIDEVRIAGTPVSQAHHDNLYYGVYPPSSHAQTFGNIQASFWPGYFFENVYTAAEVSDQELSAFDPAGSNKGPFTVCPPKTKTTIVINDLYFPRGLYVRMEDGSLYPWGALLQIIVREIDDDGIPTGPAYSKDVYFTTYDNSGSGYTSPKRFTDRWWGLPEARYSCEIGRYIFCDGPGGDCDTKDDGTISNMCVWTGLKGVLGRGGTDLGAPVYGNVTMLAVVAKASNGFSQDVLNRFTVKCTRKLPDFTTEAEGLIVTNSHAHAFADIYRNSIYGANRPKNELDIEALTTLYQRTNCLPGFNAMFDTRTTIWEALSLSVAAIYTFPVTNGATLSVVEDRPQETASHCFNESNIVKDSLSLSYKFDDLNARDGVEVEYRDPDTFAQMFVIFPETSVEPESINLFGCTSKSEALKYAERIWLQRTLRREFISFTTELEGNLPTLGALISVKHTLIPEPMCYVVGNISPQSDYTVKIEGHKYGPAIYGNKKKRIINIPAIREGIYDMTDPAVGYARGIKASGYKTTDVITLTLPADEMFASWSPWGNPVITYQVIQAYFYMSYDDIKHMCDMDFDWSVIIVFMEGQRIDIWEGDCECCAQSAEEIQYLCNTYWPGVFNTTIIEEAPGQRGIRIARASGAVGSRMDWAYTYFYHDYNDHFDLKQGSSYTIEGESPYSGTTNWFKVLEGAAATSYTEIGTYGGFGPGGQFYNGYEAARQGFTPRTLTGSTEYTFVIEDGLFSDNAGGLSIQLEVP